MVLLNIYGKIQDIIISKKLGIGLLNPRLDWINGFVDDMKEEMLIRKNDIRKFKKYDFNCKIKQYNPHKIVNINKWSTKKIISNRKALNIIAHNLVGIEVIDFENSYINYKNPYIDSPTCEKNYAYKFIKFCNKIQKGFINKNNITYIPFVIYSSDKMDTKPLILNFASSINEIEDYNKKCIKSLLEIGKLVDNFLRTEEEFWLLDYIINALVEDEEYNAYYVFKIMSLIEMLIINPKNNGKTVGEMERKLPQFISNEYAPDEKKEFSSIVRRLRNKIGHGDYNAIRIILSEYREKLAKDFCYDEFEYSIETWNFLSISIKLNEILGNIVALMLTNRKKLNDIKFDRIGAGGEL